MVRSNRPLPTSKPAEARIEDGNEEDTHHDGPNGETEPRQTIDFDPIKDEIPYPQILNRLLPPEIRILAWCPSPPPDFSARFSCTERCYKYFFTQPAYAPTPGMAGVLPAKDSGTQRREGWLDIGAMGEAAEKFKGSHDFRNFCKVDPGKQIVNFRRLITHSNITLVRPRYKGPVGFLNLPHFQQHYPPDMDDISDHPFDDYRLFTSQTQPTPVIHAFEVHGSGFLWHQVRHMVAILFLIGQGLERPSLVDDLLDIEKTPQKPVYDMADAAPLVLEDCKFNPELQWIYLGDSTGNGTDSAKTGLKSDGKYGIGGAVDELWKVWHKHKIDETLAGSLLDLVVRGHKDQSPGNYQDHQTRSEEDSMVLKKKGDSQRVFLGGDAPRHVGEYTPVLRRPRMETVEVVNAKYLKRKGLEPPERNKAKTASYEEDG